MDDLLKNIDKTERKLDDFYKRMICKINDCKSEIQKCSIGELPLIKIDETFEEFLQQDHVPIKLYYDDDDDDGGDETVNYLSDFDNDDSDSKKGESENESVDSYDPGDQVDGKSVLNEVTKLSGARPKRSEQSAVKTQSVILSSDEITDTSVNSKLSIEQTPLKRKKIQATELKHLTGSTQYSLKENDEKIYAFSELKYHLSDCDPIPASNPTLALNESNVRVMDTGDLELPTCADVKLFETYIITVSGEGITKLDRESKRVLGKLNLKSPGQMCLIGRSGFIGIIQTNSSITIVSTKNDLKVVYKIKTTRPYTNICFVETYTRTPKGLPDPSYTFAAVYTNMSNSTGKLFTEKVDLVKAKATTVSQRVAQYDAREDAFELTRFDISGISGIGVIWSDDKLNVILGCATKIICIVKSKSLMEKKWEISIRKAATDVVCVKPKIYVCVQDEGRIMLVDKDGTVENENVLEGILQCRPHKLSVNGDNLLVKSFEDTTWRNLVFAKQKQ